MPKMFEIGVICIVVLAVGYWVTLWLMGRHDDVLHGDFVHPEGANPATTSALPALPFPLKPFLAKSAADNPAAANVLPAQASPASRPDQLDTLQSLLVSIKRDLKDAAQL
jgi:hypothetical protein